jgi:hypothetical protein
MRGTALQIHLHKVNLFLIQGANKKPVVVGERLEVKDKRYCIC